MAIHRVHNLTTLTELACEYASELGFHNPNKWIQPTGETITALKRWWLGFRQLTASAVAGGRVESLFGDVKDVIENILYQLDLNGYTLGTTLEHNSVFACPKGATNEARIEWLCLIFTPAGWILTECDEITPTTTSRVIPPWICGTEIFMELDSAEMNLRSALTDLTALCRQHQLCHNPRSVQTVTRTIPTSFAEWWQGFQFNGTRATPTAWTETDIRPTLMNIMGNIIKHLVTCQMAPPGAISSYQLVFTGFPTNNTGIHGVELLRSIIINPIATRLL